MADPDRCVRQTDPVGNNSTKKRRGKVAGSSPSASIIFLSAVMLFVSLIGVASQGPAYFHDRDVRSEGAGATGVVTEVVHYTTHSRHGTHEHYYPVIATTIRGVDATTRTKAYNVSNSSEFFVGQRLAVVYDTRDPSRVVPDWPGAERDIVVSFWLLSGLGIAAVLAIAVTLVVRRIRRTTKR